MRMGSLNVGSMAGKGREAEDLVMRRKIEVLRVQETRCRERQQVKRVGRKLYAYLQWSKWPRKKGCRNCGIKTSKR